MTALSPWQPSARAQVITRRTYSRPLENGGFETWEQTVDRVISHQRWLWERALGDRPLNADQHEELAGLKHLFMERLALPSGRSLWLGGTDIARRRESSMFNCSNSRVATIHDIVDVLWLLLQGCGVGFEPVIGGLNGFTRPAEVEVIRSQRHLLVQQRGRDANSETYQDGVWRLTVGDSAEAWAKAVGKLFAQKKPFTKIVLDFSQIRPAGYRLKGYGWISSGDEMLAAAMEAICGIMNRQAGKLLSRIDILDCVNWLGTVLSSRRSAQIAIVPYGDPEWRSFATAKKDHWLGNKQRAQSNNSLMFYDHPGHSALTELFDMMQDAGGSEPGMINAQAALKRAPWFKGVNPCGEIMLPDKGFCNLVETNLSRFNGRPDALKRTQYLMGRANYRATCVNLDDGILQRSWHENNEFLRLCGIGVTGVVQWEGQHSKHRWQALREAGVAGANSMADELCLPRAKAVTTVKPSGTLSKVMDSSGEGLHKPLGRYIFNNVRFSTHDPFVEDLQAAGYRTFADPYASDGVLVSFPVEASGVEFSDVAGREVNQESALTQLNRYKKVMDGYVDHNASVTISYDPSEVKGIVDWMDRHWDSYVGVSFLYRNDATKTAADLGYPYLPQEVVTAEAFHAYTATLRPLGAGVEAPQLLSKESDAELSIDSGECATGGCPVR